MSEGLIRLFRELGTQATPTRSEAPLAAASSELDAASTASPEPAPEMATVATTPAAPATEATEPEQVVLRIESAAFDLVAPTPEAGAGSRLAEGPARPVEAPANRVLASARRGADLVAWIVLLLSLSAATALVVANSGLPELFALALGAGG